MMTERGLSNWQVEGKKSIQLIHKLNKRKIKEFIPFFIERDNVGKLIKDGKTDQLMMEGPYNKHIYENEMFDRKFKCNDVFD